MKTCSRSWEGGKAGGLLLIIAEDLEGEALKRWSGKSFADAHLLPPSRRGFGAGEGHARTSRS